MNTHEHKQLRWIKQVQVPPRRSVGSATRAISIPTARERLIAALAERPQTVAQLAASFGLSQPTVLDHVRRALRDGVIIEVEVAPTERRFAAERYINHGRPPGGSGSGFRHDNPRAGGLVLHRSGTVPRRDDPASRAAA